MNRNALGWLAVAVQAVLLLALVVLPGRRALSALWPPDVAGVLGALCIAAAVWIFLLAARTLSSALTPNPVPLQGQTLRTSGVYAHVRHPIYSAVLLAAIGYTLAVGSWWQVGVSAVLAVFFSAKARWEDALLAEQYGQQWQQWRSQTWALIPRLGPR